MKVYSRERKKWISKELDDQDKEKKLKKAKTCRGGKSHDFQLVIPSYISPEKELSQEDILEYYNTEERIADFITAENQKLKARGIPTMYHTPRAKYRTMRCSVCGKRDYSITK